MGSTSFIISTGSSQSPCGMVAASAWCWRATDRHPARCSTPCTTGGWCLPEIKALFGVRGMRAGFARRARAGVHLLVAQAPTTVFDGEDSRLPVTSWCSKTGAPTSAYWDWVFPQCDPVAQTHRGGGARMRAAGRQRTPACFGPMCRSAATLTGGLDSSIVAALVRAMRTSFHTFSFASRMGSSTRPTTSGWWSPPRRRAPRVVVSPRDRRGVPARGDRARRAPDPAHRAGAALPACRAGAPPRHQGGADRRGRRRDVRRLRPVPRRQGAPLLGAQPQSAAAPRLLERLYPYLARSPVAQQAMGASSSAAGLAAPTP